MQTTLAVDEAAQVVDVLRERFPLIESSPTDDICYATTNRQQAVRAIAAGLRRRDRGRVDELVELAAAGRGRRARGHTGASGRRRDQHRCPSGLNGAPTVGLTAGASAPPHLVDEVIGTLRALGPVDVTNVTVAREDVTFTLPKEVAD